MDIGIITYKKLKYIEKPIALNMHSCFQGDGANFAEVKYLSISL